MRNNDIAIILPTRGLLFTKVAQAIEEIRQHTWHKFHIYYTNDKPIPDCLNYLVTEALKEDITHFWFIEEDTVPPIDVLNKLVNSQEDITYVNYAVNGWSCAAHEETTHKTLWCGFGCTMVKRHVFEKVAYPWFRSDKKLRLNTMEWIDVTNKDTYGGHDIWFFSHAREAGCTFLEIDGECEHLRLDSLGRPEINKGLHSISIKEKITKDNIVNFSPLEGV